jgi:hypothetical protein
VLVTVWWSGCWSRRPIRTERVRRVAHGWNIDSAVGSDAPDLQYTGLARLERVGVERSAGARCWVLRDQASYRVWVASSPGTVRVRFRAGGGWAYGSFVGPHDVRPFGLGECGADRMLRTTQWTRASLDSRDEQHGPSRFV